MHYPIVLLTDKDIYNNESHNKTIDLLVNSKQNICKIIDENTLEIDNEIIYFDYLIIDSIDTFQNLFLKNNIYLNDENIPITNCFHQTTIDNIFSIGSCSSSTKTITQQLLDITNFLKEV